MHKDDLHRSSFRFFTDHMQTTPMLSSTCMNMGPIYIFILVATKNKIKSTFSSHLEFLDFFLPQ